VKHPPIELICKKCRVAGIILFIRFNSPRMLFDGFCEVCRMRIVNTIDLRTGFAISRRTVRAERNPKDGVSVLRENKENGWQSRESDR
jgi:hypothetical protein